MEKEKIVTVAFSIPESLKDRLDIIVANSNGKFSSRSHALTQILREATKEKSPKQLSKAA